MPVYDYICKDCNKTFEKIITLAEHEKETVSCPSCGSRRRLHSLRRPPARADDIGATTCLYLVRYEPTVCHRPGTGSGSGLADQGLHRECSRRNRQDSALSSER